MGLERLHLLTTSGSYRLRLEFQETVTGYWISIEYWFFYIEDEAATYTLHVTGYVPGDNGRVLCVYETVLSYITRRYSSTFTKWSGLLTVSLMVC